MVGTTGSSFFVSRGLGDNDDDDDDESLRCSEKKTSLFKKKSEVLYCGCSGVHRNIRR